MGTILNGILGGVSGKVAGVVGSSWKGIDYIRAYAIPANPKTPAQTAHRQKMAAIVAFAKTILNTVISTYWNPFASGMSGYNLFSRVNLFSWQSATDYQNAIVAQGTLEQEAITLADYDPSTGSMLTTWTPSGLGNGLGTDVAVALVVDVTNNISFMDTSAIRSDGTVTYNIGAGRLPASLHSFLFFTRGVAPDMIVSDSNYSVVV